jgi:8-oxo-dGTP diphosphatase
MSGEYNIVITTVVDGDGNLLMIRRVGDDSNNAGKWEFPAGHIDGGERPEVAAVREVFEETGLNVYLMPWSIDVPTKAGKAAQFLGFVINGDVKPEPDLAEDEHDRHIWIKAKDLKRVKPTHRNMDVHLTQLLKKMKAKLAYEPSREGAIAIRDCGTSSCRLASEGRAFLVSPEGKLFNCGNLHAQCLEKYPEVFRNTEEGAEKYYKDYRELVDKEGWGRISFFPPTVSFQCRRFTRKFFDVLQDMVLHSRWTIGSVQIVIEIGENAFSYSMGRSDVWKIPGDEFKSMSNYTELRRYSRGANRRQEKSMTFLRRANQLLPTRMVRHLPEPGEDLKEAILVGDEVEIFLKDQVSRGEDSAPDVSGIVDRRNRNTLWIRPSEEDEEDASIVKSPLMWKNDGDWAFIRVYRDPDQVIHYVKGNPYDPDKKTMERAKGLGLILETNPPDYFESVFALMRNETPDLDRSMGQAPQSFDEIAPFHEPRPGIPPILHRVREVLRDSGLEPDLVDHVGNGRVLILTQDSDMKKDIVRVLQKGGVEVKAGRHGDLIASEGRKRYAQSGGTTTIPIETDDELMRPTIVQKKRELQREREEQADLAVRQAAPTALAPGAGGTPGVGQLGPQLAVTMDINPQDQINQLKKYGKPEMLPNKQVQVNFPNAQKMKQFQTDMRMKNQQFQMAASRQGKRKIAGHLIRCFRNAMRKGNYGSASDFLMRLLGMNLQEESIVKSRLASRNEWAELSYYATGVGDLGVSRISRRAARLAPEV